MAFGGRWMPLGSFDSTSHLVIATGDDETVGVFDEESEEQEEDFAGIGTYTSPQGILPTIKIY